MKKILMIAFHFPPLRGSSGVQRTLKFARYLPDHGWQPIILSANRWAYPQIGDDQLQEIPSNVRVHRVFALDTARHIAIRGLYLRSMALPDRWVSWWLGAVPFGLFLLLRHRPEIIWSTFPIATAHWIGLTLHRLSGLPWIADFRDSMTEDDYPRDPLTRRCYRSIEKRAMKYSSRVVFTAESTRQMYLKRYPGLRSEQCLVIPNGYDEDDFKNLISFEPMKPLTERPMRLIHSGVIYPDDRDPRPFFGALSRLKAEGRVDARNLRVDLRASGSETYFSDILSRLAIDDLVHLLPDLPYRRALEDCVSADALLLFQAASCDHQIPAKAYEYLRMQKPILALTADTGDTAALLRENGGATIIDLSDEQAIYLTFPSFLNRVRNGTHPLPDCKKVRRYSRQNQALQLSACLSQLLRLEETL